MNYYSVSNSPSFQANLKIKDLKFNDVEKLTKVKEIFANKSKHYADDILEIRNVSYRNDADEILKTADFTLNNGDSIGSALTKDLKTYFENNSASDIAKSLLRVFKKGKAVEVFGNQIEQISRNIKRTTASQVLNFNKAVLALERGDNRFARIYNFMETQNKNRVNTLMQTRRLTQERFDNISEKIANDPISDIVIWE